MLLSDELLLNYRRCSRRTFLNIYGDSSQKTTESEFLTKLRREAEAHIADTLTKHYPVYHQPKGRSRREIAQETEYLMRQGVDCIREGVLCQDISIEGELVTLVGQPHLLVKKSGASKFGPWSYTPVSIQLGKDHKPEYKIIVAFYALLLHHLQGSWPKNAQIILRRQNTHEVMLTSWVPKMRSTLLECITMIRSQEEPEVFISRQKCSLCQWHSYCHEVAVSQQHLSLVPGVSPSRYKHLQTKGINTLEAMTTMTAGDEVMEDAIVLQLKQQATSLLYNRPLLKMRKELPSAEVELYFDIEAEPELGVDYLLGVVLWRCKASPQEEFYPFLAKTPQEEGIIWENFLKLVDTYPTAPIFHYSAYEVDTIMRLGELYGTPKKRLNDLVSRLVDLHELVVTTVTLPTENYSLKTLAKWLGFRWRDEGISGEQCVCWYDRWLQSGDVSLLEAIIRYNHDDCRATLLLKNWLAEFMSKTDVLTSK